MLVGICPGCYDHAGSLSDIYINVCAHYIYCSLGAWSGSLKMLDIYPFCSCECVVEQNHSQSPCSVPRLFLSCRRHGLQETFHSHLDHKHPLGRAALKWFQPKPGCESTIGWACGSWHSMQQSNDCVSQNSGQCSAEKKCLVLCLKNRVPTMNQKACELRAGLISLDNQPLMKQSFKGPKFEAHRMACAFGPSLAAGSPRPWMGDAMDFTCHLMISCILYICLYFVHHMVLFLF